VVSVRATTAALVGRREELASLDAAWVRAVGGATRVVLVSGEAGVGKTRLLGAFTEAARARGAVLLSGRCPPLAVGELAYAPVADALRTLARSAPRSRLGEWLGERPGALAGLVPDVFGAAAAPHVAGGMGADRPVGRLFAELMGVLERLSRDATVVLSVEDLHWSDWSTRDLLGLVLRAAVDLAMLVVLTLRTDEPAPGDPVLEWLAELDRAVPVQRVELAPFDRAELATLLGEILGEPAPAALVEQVFARCGGNAYFAEELLAAHRAGSAGLPSTVRDSVLGRLGRLGEPVQNLVSAAAITAGSAATVEHDLLAAVVGQPPERAAELAREAVAAHLLRPVEPDGYAFRHALAREAIDAHLLAAQRRHWHVRVAEALSRADTADPVGRDGAGVDRSADVARLARIAHHLHAAGDASQALAAAVTAGRAAQAGHANAEAAELYQRALTLWSQVGEPASIAGIDQIEILSLAAEAAQLSTGGRRCYELATQALALVDPVVEPDRAAWLHVLRSRADWDRGGDTAFGLGECEAALALARKPGPARAETLVEYTRLLIFEDRNTEMGPLAAEAIEVGRGIGHVAAQVNGLVGLAMYAMAHGDTDAALDRLARAIDLARSRNYPVGWALSMRANLYEWCGRLGAAADEWMASAQEGARFGMTVGAAICSSIAATLMVDLGRWVEADARTAAPRSDSRVEGINHLLVRASLLTARGDLAEAREVVEELTGLVGSHRGTQFVEQAANVEAELALWMGQPERARAAVADAMRRIRAGGSERTVARLCWLGLRAEADIAERGDGVDPAAIGCIDAELSRPGQVLGVSDRAFGLLAGAERTRIAGRSQPSAWLEAAEAHDAMGARYCALYPRWRAAQAHVACGARDPATTVIRRAHNDADELGALPVRDALASTAQRARIRLEEQPRRRPVLPYGLTTREIEVLGLLVEGATNRRIAEALWISERTVDAHVSRVLAKVGATRRTEAAAMAHRAGLFGG
jgi:DNA-binding CsgD family transcriptional regulator